MPLIPELWRQRQVDLCEFKARLVYKMSYRAACYIEKSCLKKREEEGERGRERERKRREKEL